MVFLELTKETEIHTPKEGLNNRPLNHIIVVRVLNKQTKSKPFVKPNKNETVWTYRFTNSILESLNF